MNVVMDLRCRMPFCGALDHFDDLVLVPFHLAAGFDGVATGESPPLVS